EDTSSNVAKNTDGMSSASVELVLSSSGDHTVEKMIEYGNNKGTHVENVRQTPINSTVDSNLGNSYAK
ncbi:hypothetical protein Tco_1528889, partial [Tanacetum coccineum]